MYVPPCPRDRAERGGKREIERKRKREIERRKEE